MKHKDIAAAVWDEVPQHHYKHIVVRSSPIIQIAKMVQLFLIALAMACLLASIYFSVKG